MSTPQFDDNSPYATLRFSDVGGYMRATVKVVVDGKEVPHPIADARGRVRIHRAVLFDAIGEGPHVCHWCGHGGLRWDVGQYSVDYLVVDHIDGNRLHDRLANLAPAHAWCNNNRRVVERLGIPWERVAEIPPADRPNLRSHGGEPNDAARALAAGATEVVAAELETLDAEPSPEPVDPSPPSEVPEHRWYVWDDYVDRDELAKGNVRLIGPPEWLLAKYPKLRRVDFRRFGR